MSTQVILVFFVFLSVVVLIILSAAYLVQGWKCRRTLLFVAIKAEFLFWLMFFIVLTQVDLFSYHQSSLVAGLIYALIRSFSIVSAILYNPKIAEKRWDNREFFELKDPPE